MSTAELKTNLHRLIDKANNNRTLKIIYLLLSKESKSKEVLWDSLTSEEKAAIEEGLADIENGRVLSHEQVMKEIKAEFPSLFK